MGYRISCWEFMVKTINNMNIGTTIDSTNFMYSIGFTDYHKTAMNILIKLGYVEELPSKKESYRSLIVKLKDIPTDLKLATAQRLAKQSSIDLSKGRRKTGYWSLLVDSINEHDITLTYNIFVEFKKRMKSHSYIPTPIIGYLNVLCRLEFIEKLDKNGNYKILKKVPNRLSSSLASKYLTDNMYKRQIKLMKIKEKLTNDITRDI